MKNSAIRLLFFIAADVALRMAGFDSKQRFWLGIAAILITASSWVGVIRLDKK